DLTSDLGTRPRGRSPPWAVSPAKPGAPPLLAFEGQPLERNTDERPRMTASLRFSSNTDGNRRATATSRRILARRLGWYDRALARRRPGRPLRCGTPPSISHARRAGEVRWAS